MQIVFVPDLPIGGRTPLLRYRIQAWKQIRSAYSARSVPRHAVFAERYLLT
jgi:hypothetical protein